MELGTKMEPIIRELFEKETGLAGTKPESMFVSLEHPYLFANLDWVSDDGQIVTDFKRISYADDWKDGTAPVNYLFQIQAQMLVSGASKGILYALHHNDTYTVEAKADAEIQAAIIKGCAEFWERVQTSNPPDPETGREAMLINPVVKEEAVKLGEHLKSVADEHKAVKEQIAELEAKQKKLEATLIQAMGDCKKAKIEGWNGSLSRFVKAAHTRPASHIAESPQFRINHPKGEK